MEIEEKFIGTEFGKICYLEAGVGDKTVVFLHGGMGTPMFEGEISKLLAIDGYKIISPYLPGHGKSFSLPNGFNFNDFVGAVDLFIRKLNLTGACVIGHSFGGAVTIGLSLNKTPGIKKFMAMDPVINGGVLNLFIIAVALMRDAFTDKAIKAISREFFDIKIARTPLWKLNKIWQAVKTVNIGEIKKDIPDNLAVIWGKDDTVLPLSSQKLVLPKIDLVPGGHFWHIRSKTLFYEKVSKFLEE